MPAMEIAQTMAHGTTVAAFEASSDICTQESNEPAGVCRLQAIIVTGATTHRWSRQAPKSSGGTQSHSASHTLQKQIYRRVEQNSLGSGQAPTVCEIAESVASTVLEFLGSRGGECDDDSKTKPESVHDKCVVGTYFQEVGELTKYSRPHIHSAIGPMPSSPGSTRQRD